MQMETRGFKIILYSLLLVALVRESYQVAGPTQSSDNSTSFVSVVSLLPDTLILNTQTSVTVKLNSTSCSALGTTEDVGAVQPKLQLKNAVADEDVVFLGRLAKDCDAVVFNVATSALHAGSYPVEVTLWDDYPLPHNAPQVLHIQDPPQVFLASSPWLHQADNLDMHIVVPVQISSAAPLPVSVSLRAAEASAIELVNTTLTWSPNDDEPKNFTARLLNIPTSRQIHLTLTKPKNALIRSDSADATLDVDNLPVPVFQFEINKAVYRGDPVHIRLLVDGSSSSNDSLLGYRTNVLLTGYDAGQPTLRVVNALTKTGVLHISSQQTSLPTLNFSINWNLVPFDAEYQVSLKLTPIRNAQVQNQADDVALFVYGVERGMCPPGTSLAANNTNASSLSFASDAPLQDLRLEVCCDENNESAPYNISLFPSFTPKTPSYKAMVPYGKHSVALAFTSSRPGDLVTITSCTNRTSRFAITKSQKSSIVDLGNNTRSCTISIAVLTPVNGSAAAAGGSAVAAAFSSAAGNVTSTNKRIRQVVVAEEVNGTEYRSLATYKVHVAPLVNPELLKLRAISLVNDTTILVLCGSPSLPAKFTAPAPEPADEADSSDDGGDGEGGGPPMQQVVPIIIRTPYTLDTCVPEACMFANVSDAQPPMQMVPEAEHPYAPEVEYVTNGTLSLDVSTDAISSRGYFKVPITLKANDNVTSETYTLVLLTTPLRAPAPANAMEMEGYLQTTCSSDSSIRSGKAISSEATTTTAVTSTTQAQALRAYALSSRNSSFPTPPAANPNCTICPNGSYSSRPNAAVCQLCPPGQYATLLPWPAPLPTSCTACKPGTYTFSWGSASCRPCFPGTYTANTSSIYCSICPDNFTNSMQGSSRCNIPLTNIRTLYNSTYADVVSFGVVVNGTRFDQLVNQTGINASSVTIISLLIRTDVATFFGVAMDAVVVTGSQYLSRRALLVNVSATVPYQPDMGVATDTKQLSADDLVQQLNQDPDGVFMRTTKMTGAQVSVTGLQKRRVRLHHNRHHVLLHAILWPVLFGMLLVCGGSCWACRRCRRVGYRRPCRFFSDSLCCFRWLRSSPSSPQGSDRSELELRELTMGSISPPPRQRAKQFITDSSQFDRFQDYPDTSSRYNP